MKGNPQVVVELNAALSAELTAIVQYMVQAEMCENWGYKRLGHLTRSRAIEEMRHAEGLIERILYLDGTPEVAVALKPVIGADVRRQLDAGLVDELDAVKQYNRSLALCEEAGDNGSRDLFEHMIQDEERHIDFLESQLHMIREAGLENYLAQQLKQ